MASLLMRRSGVGVGYTADVIGWRADTVIQVGVGGYHKEVEVLREEWPGVQFIGFDPLELDPKDYDGTLYPIAIGDYCGIGTFRTKCRHPEGSSMYPIPDQPDAKQKQVEVTTLDTLFLGKELGRVLLWLDCEGSELPALRGGEKFFPQVEVVNAELSFRDGNAVGVYDWLAAHEMFIQWIHTHRPASGQCDGVFVRRHLFKPKYCCVPTEIKRFLE